MDRFLIARGKFERAVRTHMERHGTSMTAARREVMTDPKLVEPLRRAFANLLAVSSEADWFAIVTDRLARQALMAEDPVEMEWVDLLAQNYGSALGDPIAEQRMKEQLKTEALHARQKWGRDTQHEHVEERRRRLRTWADEQLERRAVAAEPKVLADLLAKLEGKKQPARVHHDVAREVIRLRRSRSPEKV